MIVINPSTRQFNIPGADLTFGVEADSGSEIKHFQCPRYVGNNLDIAGSFVRINYRNANGEIDSYLVNDVAVDGDNVTFSWVLSPKVTDYKGQIRFVLCVVGPDTKVKWHTTLGMGQVLEGLEPDSAMIEEGTADIVAQLIAMVDTQTAAVEAEGANQIKAVQSAARTAQSDAVAQIEAKGVNVRASIPDDYTALSETVDGLVRSRAGAIVCEATGSAVVVNDASGMKIQGLRIFGRSTQDGTPTPDAPVEIKSVVEPVVKVVGRNLLNLPQTIEKPTSGYNYDLFTGTGGVATAIPVEKLNMLPMVKAGETYYFSYDISDHDGEPALRIIPVNKDGSIHTTNGSVSAMFENKGVFTPSMDSLITIRVGNASTMTISNIQLEYGSAATDYEPYRGGTLTVTHTLPGIPVTSGGNYTDSDGQQWICDEVDLERGVYVQRLMCAVFDGSDDEGWRRDYTSDETKRRMTTSLLAETVKKVANNQVANVLCSRFVKARADDTYSLIERVSIDDLGRLHIYSNDYNDLVEDWTSFLASNPMSVVCELATPVETALSETEIAAYRAMHSNYPNTTVLNDSGAHMVVKYAADTKLYIDNKIAALVGGV